MAKKDLGMMAMAYGNVYVANVALSNPGQVVKAFIEAEAYDGPSLIIAYSHCIAHGIDMTKGVDREQEGGILRLLAAVSLQPGTGSRREEPAAVGQQVSDYFIRGLCLWREPLQGVSRRANPEAAAVLMKKATAWTASRFEYYQKLAALSFEDPAKK